MAKTFCSLPWDGIHINQNLDVFFCCLMASADNVLGNLKQQPLEEILNCDAAREIREEFLAGNIPRACQRACGTKTGDIVNDLTPEECKDLYLTHRLTPTAVHSADIRSSNLCTLDCVYCGSLWSSTIAKREGQMHLIPSAEIQRQYQQHISNIDLKETRRLFLAGGEPLLMKEYIDLLNQVLEYNPECQINVNTGLSVINTPVFALLKQLKNVTWIVSVDTTDPDKFAYIRHGNTWDNFVKNLSIIQDIEHHNVVAHMVYFSLSYKNFDASVRRLKDLGIKRFLVDPVFHDTLDIRNTPSIVADAMQTLLQCKESNLIDEQTYARLMQHLDDLDFTRGTSIQDYLAVMDNKYSMNSRLIFPELYEDSNASS